MKLYSSLLASERIKADIRTTSVNYVHQFVKNLKLICYFKITSYPNAHTKLLRSRSSIISARVFFLFVCLNAMFFSSVNSCCCNRTDAIENGAVIEAEFRTDSPQGTARSAASVKHLFTATFVLQSDVWIESDDVHPSRFCNRLYLCA